MVFALVKKLKINHSIIKKPHPKQQNMGINKERGRRDRNHQGGQVVKYFLDCQGGDLK